MGTTTRRCATRVCIVAFSLALAATAWAQPRCRGTLSGLITSDVIVPANATCTLDGALITGSVLVRARADLNVRGGTTVNGNVLLERSGDLLVTGGSQLGSVQLNDSGNVTVRGGASVTSLRAINSRDVRLRGGAIIRSEVSIEGGNGTLSACDSIIGAAAGTSAPAGSAMVLTSNINVRIVASASCGASQINGSISLKSNTGRIHIAGLSAPVLDVSVERQTGNVSLTDLSLSDLKFIESSGNLTVRGVTTDSDAIIQNNTGDIALERSLFVGDTNISGNDRVTIADSSFSLEVVQVSENRGRVLLRNVDMAGVTINGNAGNVTVEQSMLRTLSLDVNGGNVTLNGNELGSVSVVGTGGRTRLLDNTVSLTASLVGNGPTVLRRNTIALLTCSGNSPAPTGSGNRIATPPVDGQCSQL